MQAALKEVQPSATTEIPGFTSPDKSTATAFNITRAADWQKTHTKEWKEKNTRRFGQTTREKNYNKIKEKAVAEIEPRHAQQKHKK